MEASDAKMMKDLQEENSRLKTMFFDLDLVHGALRMR
jgi:hypothetical protein